MSMLTLAMAGAAEGFTGLWVVGIVAALLMAIVIFLLVFSSRYIKVGPNEVLIVLGMNHRVIDAQGREKMVGFRIKKGGGTFVLPIFEKAETLSLELMTIDIKTPSGYAISGVPV